MFWRNMFLPYSRSKNKPSKKPASRARYLAHAGLLFGFFFDPENGGNMFLQNVGRLLMDYMALYPRKYNSS
jgi:hypothetical protein